ncbi:hypothetical protein [Bacillus pinisoli]|uniref:hypothetical protein n=1 Tax=Bacillus pinisoli TaxID=2901866 RepID=UPI001FF67B72|nr:hypothetical protein [Bacillus pinisoli]
MKKILVAAALLIGGLTVGGTTSSAAYDSSGDLNVNINFLGDYLQFSDSTGDATFQLQEDVHNTLTSTTGLEVNHSYAWVNINGAKVLAVDPPKPYFNRGR